MRESVKNKPAIVYCAVNALDRSKFYIGVTSCGLEERKRHHKYHCNENGGKRNGYFQNAIRKHGFEVFNWYVLSKWDNYQDALNEEIRVIALTNAPYNTTGGGEGMLGYKPNEDTIKRMSEASKKRPMPPHVLLNLKHNKKGDKLSEETKKKISESKKGKPSNRINYIVSEETKEKMSLSKLEKPTRYWLGKKRDSKTIESIRLANTGKPAKNRRKIKCITDGNIFVSIRETATFYKVSESYITQLCKNNKSTKSGLSFKYLEKE